MKKSYFLSVCIPSYNRPSTLRRLLNSIDTTYSDIVEIVICEDKSPARELIREVVMDYKSTSQYDLVYVENVNNLGFDKNWRELSLHASGKYLLYMGDDDGFIPGQLDVYIEWLKEHPEPCYILRSYVRDYGNGKREYFRYYDDDLFFQPGVEGYKAFFMKSISMSGYTIKRECALEFMTSDLDNTLLFQLYLLAEVCFKYPSAYCNTPCAMLISDQVQLFGNSSVEKKLYTPGEGVGTNVNFILAYFRIADYIDNKYNLSLADYIKKEYSKYSYYVLAGKRHCGVRIFNQHVQELRKIGLDSSVYFNVYYIGLLLFGKTFCTKFIRFIKKVKGRSLQL